jgi:hypothetical protein
MANEDLRAAYEAETGEKLSDYEASYLGDSDEYDAQDRDRYGDEGDEDDTSDFGDEAAESEPEAKYYGPQILDHEPARWVENPETGEGAWAATTADGYGVLSSGAIEACSCGECEGRESWTE